MGDRAPARAVPVIRADGSPVVWWGKQVFEVLSQPGVITRSTLESLEESLGEVEVDWSEIAISETGERRPAS